MFNLWGLVLSLGTPSWCRLQRCLLGNVGKVPHEFHHRSKPCYESTVGQFEPILLGSIMQGEEILGENTGEVTRCQNYAVEACFLFQEARIPLVSFKLADSHWKKNSELPLIPTQCSGYICLKMLWEGIHMTCYNESGPATILEFRLSSQRA